MAPPQGITFGQLASPAPAPYVESDSANRRPATMEPPLTAKEIARMAAGAMLSVVIVGWIAVVAIAWLSAG
jgi:hypothetical protein